MRGLLTTVVVAGALAAVCSDAQSGNITPRNLVLLYSTTDENGPVATPQDVAPGQTVMITGDCIGDADEDSDATVILSLADGTDADVGYHAVLVTDQSRHDGKLTMRVPNITEAKHHIFRVRLFVDGNACEAGKIRIA